MAGLFFCLALTQRRLFCYQCNYPAITLKTFTWLCRGISVDLPYSITHNTAAAQAAYTPSAPRWRAYRQAQHLQHIPDTTATPDAVQGCAATYYNKVYKGAAVRTCYRSISGGAAHRRPCQPGGLRSGTGQQSGRTLHPVGQSSDKSTAGGAEPLAATAASLFGLSPDSQ